MPATVISDAGWLLELALMILLAAALFQACRLERALGVLRRDRVALEELVSGFSDSTRQAEGGIDRLQAAADGAGRQIAKHVDQAGTLKDDLEFLMSRGDKLADRLDALVRAATLPGPASPPPAVQPDPSFVARDLGGRDAEPERDVRLRSQAERDLLRALKSVR